MTLKAAFFRDFHYNSVLRTNALNFNKFHVMLDFNKNRFLIGLGVYYPIALASIFFLTIFVILISQGRIDCHSVVGVVLFELLTGLAAPETDIFY